MTKDDIVESFFLGEIDVHEAVMLWRQVVASDADDLADVEPVTTWIQ